MEPDQVLMLPYRDEIRYGSKTIPFAGWKDVHACGGPCNYLDNLYTDPSLNDSSAMRFVPHPDNH
jgi:hypothetical protein